MKKFIIMVLFAGLFVTANSVWAQSNTQKPKAATTVTKAPVSKEATKACAVDNKDATKAACCADKKDGTKPACCADKKDGTKPACCADKKDGTKPACCTSKSATTDTKSSGKK